MPHPSALQCFCQSQLIAFMGVSFKNVNTCFSLAVKVCSFIFCHFNYKLFWCGSFWVHLVWHTLCLLHLDVCFPDFGSFHLLFLQVSSLTFSPLRTPSMQILVYLLFSQKCHKPSAYFLFSVQLHWFLLLCPLMLSSVSSDLLLIPSSTYFISVSAISAHFESLYFLFIKICTIFNHYFPKFVEHLYDYYLGISVREVTYLHFSMILSHYFIWTIFLSCLILLNFLCLFLDIKEVMS